MGTRTAFWLRQALFAALGGAVGYAVAHFRGDHDLPWWLGLSLIFAALVLVTMVHEAGHIVGARLGGWKVHLVAIGPVLLQPKPPYLSLTARMIGGDVGGFVFATPQRERGWRDGALSFYSGGIVANLLLAVAAGAVYWMTRNDESPGPLAVFALWVAAFSLVLGALVNAIPFRLASGGETDGASILAHLRGRDMPGPIEAMLMLIGQAMAGTRPRDWDPRLVDALRPERLTGEQGGAAEGMRYAWYLDTGDPAAAEAALARSVELMARHPSVLIEAAFMAAYIHGDAEKARRLLDEVGGKGLFEPHALWRAEAATRLADGDATGALDAVAKAREAMARPFLQAGDDDRDILAEIEKRARGVL